MDSDTNTTGSSTSTASESAQSGLWARVVRFGRSLIERVHGEYHAAFGYDYFLAHRSADGKTYARILEKELNSKKPPMHCFLDEKHYGAGGNLSAMQQKALSCTSRLIVVVTPKAHDDDAECYLLKEVKEFRKLHPTGIIVSIGTYDTMNLERHPSSKLFKLVGYPDNIAIIEDDPQSLVKGPSAATVGKLLNDFTEERSITKRLRWMKRVAVLLLGLLVGVLWLWIRTVVLKQLVVEQRAEVSLQLGVKARGAPYDTGEISPFKAVHGLLGAAVDLSEGEKVGARDTAILAGRFAGQALIDTLLHDEHLDGVGFNPKKQRFLSWNSDGLPGGAVRQWHSESGKEIRPPMQHENAVLGAAYCANGERVLTWTNDGVVGLWNASTGERICETIKQSAKVRGAVLSGNGERILSWSVDQMAQLWDASNGNRVGEPMAHKGEVRGAAFSPDGKFFVTCSSGGLGLRLWDAVTAREIANDGLPSMDHDKSHRGLLGVAFSEHGDRILSWGVDHTVRLWDTGHHTMSSCMKHDDIVLGAVLSPDGEQVLSWSVDHTARLWKAVSGAPVGSPTKHRERVLGAAFSGRGERVVSWSSDGTIKFTDAETGKEAFPAIHLENNVKKAAFTHDDQQILTWSRDHTVRLWDLKPERGLVASVQCDAVVEDSVFSGSADKGGIFLLSQGRKPVFPGDWKRGAALKLPQDIMELIESRNPDTNAYLWPGTAKSEGSTMKLGANMKRVVFSPDGPRSLSWGEDGLVHLWKELPSAVLVDRLFQIKDRHQEPVFSANGQRILGWSEKGLPMVWQASDGKQVAPLPFDPGAEIKGAALSGDGEHLLIWRTDRSAQMWNLSNGEPEPGGVILESTTSTPVISNHGERVLTWSSVTERAMLWQGGKGAEIADPGKHWKNVNGARFSEDGQRVISWGQDNTARWWQTSTAAQIGPPMWHDGIVLGAVLSRDQRLTLTRSRDGTARLWDAFNIHLIAVFRHEGTVTSATFDPESRHVLTSGEDGTVRLWDISLDQNVSVEEHKLEFEVRSATRLDENRNVQTLSEKDWADKRRQLESLRAKRK